MSRNPLLLAAALLALSGTARAEEADLPARLEREFARLGSDDAAERDAAVAAIGKEGRPAEGAVRRRLEGEKDPETRARLAGALDAIERTELRDVVWTKVWSAEPVATPPNVCAVSADGRTIASASEDGRIRLVAAEGPRVLKELDCGAGLFPGYLAFSPDGRTLFVWLADEDEQSVQAWTVPDGERLPPFERTVGDDGYLMFSGPGGRAAMTSQGGCFGRSGVVAAWDGEKFRGTLPCAGPDFTADGRAQARPEWDSENPEKRILRLVSRDPRNGKERTCELLLGAEDFNESSPVPDRAYRSAAIVCDGRCDLYDLATGRRTLNFGVEVDSVAALEDGWLTARRDGLLQWWKDGKETRRLECGELPGMTLAAFGDRFAVGTTPENPTGGSGEKDYVVRSAADGAVIGEARSATLEGPFPENAFALFPEGRATLLFAVGCPAFEVPTSPYGAWHRANFDMGGPTVAALTAAGLEVFDLRSGRRLGQLAEFRHPVERLRWGEAGLIACGEAREFLLDGAGAARAVSGLAGGPIDAPAVDREALGVPPNSRVEATRDGAICAWSEGALLEIRWLTPGGVEKVESDMEDDADAAKAGRDARPGLAFSADGERLAVRSPSQASVDVWDLRARRRIRRLRHGLPVNSESLLGVEFASDGRTLVLHRGGAEPTAWNDAGGVLVEDCDTTAHFEGGRWIVRPTGTGVELRDVLPNGRRATFALSGEPRSSVRFLLGSADGRRALVAASPEELWLLDLLENTQLRISEECGDSFAVSLAGGLAAVLSEQGLYLLKSDTWDIGVLRAEIQGHALAGSPDGKRLAVANGREVTVFERR